MLVDRSLTDLLEAFSSSDPTPGGGSASALACAVGASLLIMVSRHRKTRSGSEENRAALQSAAAALVGLRRQLTDAIDADTAAYDLVVAAYKRRKDDPHARTAAVQEALRTATDVPLEVMRGAVRALEQARVVAAHGYRSAASDVLVAVALLMAGAAGAGANVDVNLDTVADAVYRDAVRADAQRLMEAAERSAEAVESSLNET
jgi:formiminotetrahydrofolate cyclodeaminase